MWGMASYKKLLLLTIIIIIIIIIIININRQSSSTMMHDPRSFIFRTLSTLMPTLRRARTHESTFTPGCYRQGLQLLGDGFMKVHPRLSQQLELRPLK